MNVKEIITEMDEIAAGMWLEGCEKHRSKMYSDFVDQLFAIREALGLATGLCWVCGEDGSYDCMKCGMDLCGSCVEKVEDGILCHDCYKTSAAKGNVVEMSHV